jgi:predicted regulator of Ras-like GTPase activity (Roadblock/LC7/MglB family)
MPAEKATVEKVEVMPAVSPAPASDPGSKALAVEPLWKLDPQDRLADPSALQALFMTEEKLTLERVISKAGELPGLKACVLAHGDRVLCTSNASTGIDLRTLSGQAMTMLAQIRESSAGMGLGAVPAVTLHAEQGALSFLHNGELCLLVLHADRGFIPGVRERLQEMMGHLSEAKPALPSPGESESR